MKYYRKLEEGEPSQEMDEEFRHGFGFNDTAFRPIEVDEQDAKRLDWLSRYCASSANVITVTNLANWIAVSGGDARKAIDAAMRKET